MTHSTSNVSLGNNTEEKVSRILRNHGFWSMSLKKSYSGSQPFDILAIKNTQIKCLIFCVDGKHVRGEDASFKFDRVENNQKVSMKYCHDFAGMDLNTMGFAIEFDRTGQIYWLSYPELQRLENEGNKSINVSKLQKFEDFVNLTTSNIVV